MGGIRFCGFEAKMHGAARMGEWGEINVHTEKLLEMLLGGGEESIRAFGVIFEIFRRNDSNAPEVQKEILNRLFSSLLIYTGKGNCIIPLAEYRMLLLGHNGPAVQANAFIFAKAAMLRMGGYAPDFSIEASHAAFSAKDANAKNCAMLLLWECIKNAQTRARVMDTLIEETKTGLTEKCGACTEIAIMMLPYPDASARAIGILGGIISCGEADATERYKALTTLSTLARNGTDIGNAEAGIRKAAGNRNDLLCAEARGLLSEAERRGFNRVRANTAIARHTLRAIVVPPARAAPRPKAAA